MDWGWYGDSKTVHLFLHLLLSANYKDKDWRGITIKRGQLVTSYGHLALDLGIGVQSIRTSLGKLKSTGELTIKTTNKYSLITVLKWNKYQTLTSKLTNNQQTTNKQLTTTNKYNKDNELNSGIFKKKLPPSKMIKFYNEDDTGLVLDEDGSPIIEESEKKGMAGYRLDAENLLKYYNAKYNKEVGTEVPHYPKSAYLKQVKPVLTKYKIEKLKELMDNYFYRDDEITRGNKWSMSCFLSFKILNQLND